MTEKESHMTENPWLNQPKIGPYEEPYPGYERDREWFVEQALEAVDSGSAGHWPTVAEHLADEVRRLRSLADFRMNRALDAAKSVAEAERRGAARGWDEGYAEGFKSSESGYVAGTWQQLRTSVNPHRSIGESDV